jgi:hypothetical protein
MASESESVAATFGPSTPTARSAGRTRATLPGLATPRADGRRRRSACPQRRARPLPASSRSSAAEPTLDPRRLRQLGGVEELGQRQREQPRGVGGRGEQPALFDGDRPAAGHDPAAPTERLPGTVDAEFVLVAEDDLELEPGQAS